MRDTANRLAVAPAMPSPTIIVKVRLMNSQA
jgi:hypothetical protein